VSLVANKSVGFPHQTDTPDQPGLRGAGFGFQPSPKRSDRRFPDVVYGRPVAVAVERQDLATLKMAYVRIIADRADISAAHRQPFSRFTEVTRRIGCPFNQDDVIRLAGLTLQHDLLHTVRATSKVDDHKSSTTVE
jgi:hypothetical protein